MYALVWTPHFIRSAKKFTKQHPELKKRLKKVLLDIEQDPTQPHLRLHPLSGPLEGMHALSVTYSYRITVTLQIAEKEIALLDIGSHDDMYR